MPPSALQAPIRSEPTHALGSKLFRKQLLPVGRIEYRGRTIEFSADYLQKLASNFKRRAFDQVPFVLADKDNLHTQEPDRYRGDVKGLEFTGDGLDAIVEVTDDGAKLIRENPKLGVSARIVEEGRAEIDTPRAVPAVQHVCGTLDPRLNGLRDWQVASDLSTPYAAEQVIDLTAETFTPMAGTDADNPTLTDEQRTALKDAGVPDDQYDTVAKIFAKSGDGEGTDAGTAAASPKPEDEKPKGIKAVLAKLTGRSEDEFSDEKIAALTETGEPAKPKDGEVQEVALTADAQRAVELAAQDSAAAKRAADAAQAELRNERFERTKAELIGKGVPPADIELAADILKAPESSVIELSSGEKKSPREAVIKLLEERAGTVDLTAAYGVSRSDDDPQATEAAKVADEWYKADHGKAD